MGAINIWATYSIVSMTVLTINQNLDTVTSGFFSEYKSRFI